MYRKPTHTDQYLDFNSAHPVEHKLGVVRTLHQRAEVVTSDKKDLKNEIVHVNKALKHATIQNGLSGQTYERQERNEQKKSN